VFMAENTGTHGATLHAHCTAAGDKLPNILKGCEEPFASSPTYSKFHQPHPANFLASHACIQPQSLPDSFPIYPVRSPRFLENCKLCSTQTRKARQFVSSNDPAAE
jgi:hypothetical protein